MAEEYQFEPKDQFAILGDPTISFPHNISIPGVVTQTPDGWSYRWFLPKKLRTAVQAAIWTQTGRDAKVIDRLTKLAAQKTVSGTIHAKNDDTILAIGIDVFAGGNGSLLIGQGAYSIPEPLTATPVIASTTGILPDLTFTQNSISFVSATPHSGETVFVSAEVANTGLASATDITVAGYKGHPKKGGKLLEFVVGSQGAHIQRLDPGESTPVRMRWDPTNNAGTHSIHLVVDEKNKIEEEREDNNTIASSLYVRKKADLIIDTSHTQITPTEDGERLRVYFEVLNKGESHAERIVVKLTAKLPDRETANSITVPHEPFTLEAGERYKAGGIHLPANIEYLEIVVDPDEVVDEETHRNNIYRYP